MVWGVEWSVGGGRGTHLFFCILTRKKKRKLVFQSLRFQNVSLHVFVRTPGKTLDNSDQSRLRLAH